MTTLKALDWVKKVVFDNYTFAKRTYEDIKDIIDSYPSVDVWIEERQSEKREKKCILCIKVVLQVVSFEKTYDIPVVLWVPLLYPREAPIVSLVIEEGFVIKQGNYVHSDGRCYHPCIEFWDEYSCESTLIRLFVSLKKAFSKDVPIVFLQSGCIFKSSCSTSSKDLSNDYDLSAISKSQTSLEQSSPPPLPDKPPSFLIKTPFSLQKNNLIELPQKKSVNILDSACIDAGVPSMSSSNFDLVKKPLNPIVEQLIKQIAITLQENAQTSQKTIAQLLFQVKNDREKILRSQAQIEREKTEITHIKEQCQKNIDILKEKIESSKLLIEKCKNMQEPSIDDIVIPGNALSEQFYDLISDEKSIEDTIHVLVKMLEKERIDFDTFLKYTRNLAREQFMKKALIRKIKKLESSS
ncbi:hypothetical protein PNEG_01989 [Pneumocystis murina B123]|uniref:UEV domain-containing protein n=1 Tax=Pneumocystis murina (strain B123) TaxID=1069680 RepID=M7NMC0_PNEMU|nr:hypothetical protein PNEG_01989 [Pneumocystis murina B123]EMR09808.1 hypothetical protein PNEG_01989 [Pneumocystis murina B123]